MQMASGNALLLKCLLLLVVVAASTVGQTDAAARRCAKRGSPVGVNWGGFGVKRPTYNVTVALMKSSRIGRVKFFETNEQQLITLRKSGLRLALGIENYKLPSFAADPKVAVDYVQKFILGYPRICTTSIAVGNELLPTLFNTSQHKALVPALWNIYKALQMFGLEKRIKLSSPDCCALGGSGYPPSAAYFSNTYMANGFKEYLQFLHETGSYYSANIYPFFALRSNPDIARDFGLFQGFKGYYDNGLYYQNVLDVQLDAVYNALEHAGYPDLKVVITETGWPSGGDPIATPQNQQLYNSYIIGRTLASQGSPKRPKVFSAYLFELFDSPLKGDNNSSLVEKFWGIFTDDGKLKAPPLSLTSGPTNPTKPPPQWCVAKATANSTELGNAIAWACSQGGVNCAILDAANPCLACPGCVPREVLLRKASYVFNAFYQRAWQNDWHTCDFSGTAEITLRNPNPPRCRLMNGYPGPKKWCIVKPGADSGVVQGAVDYVCSQKKDCSFISANRAPTTGLPALPGPCYSASNFSLAASFVYNLWFQANNQNPSACLFAPSSPPGGPATGQIVTVDPSYGACLMSGSSFGAYFAAM